MELAKALGTTFLFVLAVPLPIVFALIAALWFRAASKREPVTDTGNAGGMILVSVFNGHVSFTQGLIAFVFAGLAFLSIIFFTYPFGIWQGWWPTVWQWFG